MISLKNSAMKRKYLEPALLGLVLLGIIALAVYPYLRGSGNSSTPAPSEVMGDKKYSTDLNQLRAKFNQDRGRVRLLLLLSPT